MAANGAKEAKWAKRNYAVSAVDGTKGGEACYHYITCYYECENSPTTLETSGLDR